MTQVSLDCMAGRRNSDRASRRTEEERGDALFVRERGRSRRASKARSAPAMFAPPICRRMRRNGRAQSRFSDPVVSSDSTKTAAPPANIAPERAIRHSELDERGNWK